MVGSPTCADYVISISNFKLETPFHNTWIARSTIRQRYSIHIKRISEFHAVECDTTHYNHSLPSSFERTS
ncbi:hypothetical protein T4A_11444 [Trichinella pseudospiralis]|uniref:Uncharacterized protein n=1 Tax=Trichinella pseudospiralis TaxID=6337 RepID=A0A0V1E7P7_TRIPS|nr:hypothetical protein T4A_11444 [Trichinella pseudospiralis]